MKVFRFPAKNDWPDILKRPVADSQEIEKIVRPILKAVRRGGDEAVRRFIRQFDKVEIGDLVVCEDEFVRAETRVPDHLKAAMQTAKANIEKFHAAQHEEIKRVETSRGVTCWRKSVPIEKVGLYVPAGTALGVPGAAGGLPRGTHRPGP